MLALGNFDGVHRGHRKILDRVRRVAGERGATSVVMTFDPHPPRVVRPDKAPPLLMTTAQKLEAIRDRRPAGRGDRALHRPSCRGGIPRRSCRPCSSTGCASRKCGSAPTFCSATIAPATSRCCARSARRYGFKAEKIDPVRYKDFVVSSTRIRRLIGEGRVDEAGALLGHRVLHRRAASSRGDGRGRTIGFPTANLCTDNELLPPHGVYATTMTLDGIVQAIGHQRRRPADGRRIGQTVGRNARLRFRSRPVRMSAFASGFVQRLRDERRVRVARTR